MAVKNNFLDYFFILMHLNALPIASYRQEQIALLGEPYENLN
jgi:hypothetical protein